MPIGFDSNETCEITLDCVDKDASPDKRARFTCRFLTAGEAKKVQRLREAAYRQNNPIREDALLNEAIRIGIVGWRNLVGADGKVITYAPAPPPPPTPVPTQEGTASAKQAEPASETEEPAYD